LTVSEVFQSIEITDIYWGFVILPPTWNKGGLKTQGSGHKVKDIGLIWPCVISPITPVFHHSNIQVGAKPLSTSFIEREKMLLKHVALVCSSEEKSDQFYESLLGLKKGRSKMIPSTLSKQIFNFDSELKIIDYAVDEMHFEVFISYQKVADDKRIEHICFEVDDLEVFLNKCKEMGVKILQIPKEKGFLTFISDYDGNLFEIKTKQRTRA
jgi:catechol 2,3-dioxygenase-like lactoylglutathione lyase family enzyme